jgi:hypothetical protein
MKFKEYLDHLNKMAEENPEILEYETIYSHDDEGNEYQKVNHLPCLMEIINVGDNRFLEQAYDEEGEMPLENYNCVMIN